MHISAGFECGYLQWNGHDILHSTDHVPTGRMLEHYQIAVDHGVTFFRDGVGYGHDISERFKLVNKFPYIHVTWDLLHYHVINETPFDWGVKIANAWLSVNGDKEFWCCPQNEPTITPIMRGDIDLGYAIEEGREVLRGVRSILNNVKVMHVDVAGQPDWYDADIIGVNFYPHTLNGQKISDILLEAKKLGKPVVVSETSWHSGYHEQFYPEIHSKGDWLKFVMSECEVAGISLITWYPFVDQPPWDNKDDPVRWSNGLIRGDLKIDETLSEVLLTVNKD